MSTFKFKFKTPVREYQVYSLPNGKYQLGNMTLDNLYSLKIVCARTLQMDNIEGLSNKDLFAWHRENNKK